MAKNPDFFADVYKVVELIPKGRVSSYGAIAQFLGLRSSARMVGYAMNAAHSLPHIPAHRVVNRNGLLTGKMHFGSPTRMQELLEAEGIVVLNDAVQHFERVFWDPCKELSLT